MLVASWNINSITVRLDSILQWLASTQPDVLCLQETKTIDEKFPAQAFKEAGYYCEFIGQPTYNGVAILSKQPLSNVEKNLEIGGHVNAQRFIKGNIDKLVIINTYVPNGQAVGSDKFAYKIDFLRTLQNYFLSTYESSESVIWCGDFNIAPEGIDTFDSVATCEQIMCSAAERSLLKEIESWGFIDTFRKHNSEPGHFSWWDYRMGAFRRNLGYRIDHIWSTSPLADSCHRAWIDKEPRKWERPSDHAPVLAEFRLL